MRVVLDVALKQAMAEGIIHNNPVPLTVVKSVRSHRMQIMTNEIQQQLEDYLFRNRHDYHAGILIAMFTGMRLGEVCALQWKDYDADTIVRRVTEHKHLGNGSIILCHNGAKHTAEALDTMIKTLKEKGYELVPISELILQDNYEIDTEGRQHEAG